MATIQVKDLPRLLPAAAIGAALLGAGLSSAVAMGQARPGTAAASPVFRPGPVPERVALVEQLREAAQAPRHPADGSGRVWLAASDDEPREAKVGTPDRWTVGFEVGPLGIATGGSLSFFAPRFWGWSPPQTRDPEAPGYTTVRVPPEDSQLTVSTLASLPKLEIEVTGRPLREGEQILIHFGAGTAGAMADRFAERAPAFWISVDGDGDGHDHLVPEPAVVTVAPGPPARLLLTVASTARPGDSVRLTVAVLDGYGNAGVPLDTMVAFRHPVPGLDLPATLPLVPSAQGRKSAEVKVLKEGIYRIEAETNEGLTAQSNPLVVASDADRILWGDLQGHSAHSDGTGAPEEYFLYARDVAALDVAALTDHDHYGWPMGSNLLDQNPDVWHEIVDEAGRFYEPGRFVTLPGFEWMSWLHGHRGVLYFEDGGEVLSSLDPRFDTPTKLWAALRGRKALTATLHPAGGPLPTDWSFAPEPRLEPLTAIASIYGSCEAADSPALIDRAVSDSFARDALDRGYRLGFLAGGDSRDGHPGLSHLSSRRGGGLAAILSDSLDREGVFQALRSRRVYATNGPRIVLRARLDGWPMGSVIPVASSRRPEGSPLEEGASFDLAVDVVAPGELERIDLVRSGGVVESVAGERRRELAFRRTIGAVRPGEYLYLRVVQRDGGLAWSSPFFFE